MLTDLRAFIVSADTSGLDADRAAAIASIRAAIGTKMFHDILDEGVALPALTYQLISDRSDLTQDGDSGLYDPRVQIDVWAKTALSRDQISAAIVTALHGYAGLMNPVGSPVTGTPVCVITWDNSIDTFESDRKQYRRTLDFKISHN